MSPRPTDGDSTTSLGSPLQRLITLSVNKFSLMSNYIPPIAIFAIAMEGMRQNKAKVTRSSGYVFSHSKPLLVKKVFLSFGI